MCEKCIEAIQETPSLVMIGKSDEFCTKLPVEKGYVYFFTTKDLSKVKIGYSKKNPYARMGEYQNQEKQPLQMIAIYPVMNKNTERKIHKYLNHKRLHKEWFVYDMEVCSLLKQLYLKFYCGMSFREVDYLWGLK
jgi:hypothetical protein